MYLEQKLVLMFYYIWQNVAAKNITPYVWNEIILAYRLTKSVENIAISKSSRLAYEGTFERATVKSVANDIDLLKL